MRGQSWVRFPARSTPACRAAPTTCWRPGPSSSATPRMCWMRCMAPGTGPPAASGRRSTGTSGSSSRPSSETAAAASGLGRSSDGAAPRRLPHKRGSSSPATSMARRSAPTPGRPWSPPMPRTSMRFLPDTYDHTPRVLSIAGSDSGGGAGIQADLKAFAACGVHGMTAITAITAQNTVEVRSVEPVSPRMIVDQVRAVTEDIGADAVKIGMLGSLETIAAVEEALDLLADVPVVLDPVMVAESGAPLLDDDAREALARKLLPRATVVTPNVAEARELAAIGGTNDVAEASRE